MYYWIYKYCVFNVFVKKLNNNSIVFKSKIGLGNARQREENFGERGMFV